MTALVRQARRELVLLTLLVSVAGFRLAGEAGIRIGSFQSPGLELRWILLVSLAAFFLVPKTDRRPSTLRFAASAVGLATAFWPLSIWYHATWTSSPALTAYVSRVSDPSRRVEEVLEWSSLRVGARRELHRLIGRRRDIALEIDGYLLVPSTGSYRFELSCDDDCRLQIDGRELSSRAPTTSVLLESGIHPMTVLYRQTGGPSRFVIAWDRPEWLELLGLDYYVSGRTEDLDIAGVTRRQWSAGLCSLSWLVWWALLFFWIIRAGRFRRHWKESLASPPIGSRVSLTAAAVLILFGTLLRFDALLVHSHLVQDDSTAAALHHRLQPILPDYGVFDPRNAPDDPYRADVRSYLDRAASLTVLGFYDASFREPFYVSVVKMFVWASGGRELGVLVQSFFFSVAILPLFFLVASRLAGRWWALAALAPVVLHEWLVLEAPTGYRMSAYAFFLLVFVGWVFVRRESRWWVHAIMTGVFGAVVCLTRLSGLSFVLPLIALQAWSVRKERGLHHASASLLTLAVLVGPFLYQCYREHGDPFYSISFHTKFWIEAENPLVQGGGPVDLSRYLFESRTLRELILGTGRGLTILPIRTFWNGLAWYPWMSAATLAAGVVGLVLTLARRSRFLTVAYFGHLIPFAYIQNFPSGEMPRFVMPAYFFLILGGAWAAHRIHKKRLSAPDTSA